MPTDPLQGGPTPSHDPGADPVKVLAPKQPGAPGHDDHDVSGPPSPETIKRGYEEDVYDTKTVLSVPLLVLMFFVLAFSTVTVLFSVYSKPSVDPNAHPQAKARHEASLNQRIGRIGRGKEVDQPRLEPLRERTGESRAITRPEVPGVNSPELHPEDLIPTKERYPELFSTKGWFRLTDKLREALKKEGVPDAVLAKLRPIFNKELQRADFESEVAKLLTAEEKDKFQKLIVNHAAADMLQEELKKEGVPDAVLAKLRPIFNKELQRADFESEVAKLLTAEEKDKFQKLIVNHAATDKDRTGLDKTLALSDDALKGLFKSSAPPLPEDASQRAATGSNAGRGVVPPKPSEQKSAAPMKEKGKEGHQ